MRSLNFLLVLFLLIGLTFVVVSSKPSSVITTNSVSASLVGSKTSKSEEVAAGPSYYAFISYRRSVSKHLAMLLKVLFNNEKIPSFLDVEDLQAGHWDDQLVKGIRESPNFIFLLSNGTLDRCIGDTNYTDVVHQEIKEAVDTKRNIIPVFDDFTMPSAKFSPEIYEMMRFQGVEWNHSLVGGSMKRLISYLRDAPLTNLTHNLKPNKVF